jgi:hypothetical protein
VFVRVGATSGQQIALTVQRLIEVLEDKVVRPAEAKFNELLARRTQQLRIENIPP